ncbi:MAG: lysophospholipid acyltransferase family protein [Porcipelethomonas sp.]
MGIFYKGLYNLVKGIYYGLYNIKVEGKENIPEGNFIIASNHRSYVDPPVLAITAGVAKYSFVAKKDLFRFPPFACLIRALGAFPVEKGDTSVVDKSVSKILEGRNLVIFPEGTRHRDGKVGKAKTGVVLIAARSGVPVVPVGIVFGKKLRFRSRITVKYGKPIMPEEIKVSDQILTSELKTARERIMGDIKRLVEGEENGGN